MPESRADTEKDVGRFVACLACGLLIEAHGERVTHEPPSICSHLRMTELRSVYSLDALSEEHERVKEALDVARGDAAAWKIAAEAEKESMAAAIRTITRERDKARADLERLEKELEEERGHLEAVDEWIPTLEQVTPEQVASLKRLLAIKAVEGPSVTFGEDDEEAADPLERLTSDDVVTAAREAYRRGHPLADPMLAALAAAKDKLKGDRDG